MAVGFGTQIQSNLATGYLLDAKQARGGYTVVADSTELSGLSTGTGGVIIVGSLAYNQDDGKFYQYQQTATSPAAYGWVEADFGGPSNVITYSYDSSSNSNTINLPSTPTFKNDILPKTSHTYNLGNASHVFKYAYVDEVLSNSVGIGSTNCTGRWYVRNNLYPSISFTYDENNTTVNQLISIPLKSGTFALTSDIPTDYLPLSGGTLTGTLNIASGAGISDSSGNGMLVYKPSSWTGVSSSQWGVGAINCQGVIRSDANNLIHYRGSTAYTIYDSYNYPSYDTAATANTVARRDASGYLRCVYLNTSNSTEDVNNYSGAVATFQSSDGWLRKTSFSNFLKYGGWPTTSFGMTYVEISLSTQGYISSLKYQNIYGGITFSRGTTSAVTNTISNTTYGITLVASTSAYFSGFSIDSSYIRISNAASVSVTGGGAPYSSAKSTYVCIGAKFTSYNNGTIRFFLFSYTGSL